MRSSAMNIRLLIPAILLQMGFSAVRSEDLADTIKDARDRTLPACHDRNTNTTKFFCMSSGTLEGEELDSRVASIVEAVSAFYEEYNRVPNAITELRSFSVNHHIDLLDLHGLSPVRFVNGMFEYSATYGQGRLNLVHRPHYFLNSAMLETTKAEQDGAAQTAIHSESI